MSWSKLTAQECRSVRKRVMREHALGQQSRETHGCYTTVAPIGQIHCIQFASHKGGGALAVDLGVHFAWAPRFKSHYSPAQPDTVLSDECCFRKRVSLPDGDDFVPYGDSPEEAADITRWAADLALGVFSQFEEDWGDGSRLLEELPPARMRRDVRRFEKLVKLPFAEQDRVHKTMYLSRLFPDWYTFVLPLCWLLGYLAIHFEQPDLVREYLEIARRQSQSRIAAQYAVDLTPELECLAAPRSSGL
jgi:hypothetical protein